MSRKKMICICFLMSIIAICCYSKRNWFRVNWRIYLGFAKDLLQIGFTWFIIEYMCLYAMNLYMTCKELFYWPSSVKTESKLCCLCNSCVNQTTHYEQYKIMIQIFAMILFQKWKSSNLPFNNLCMVLQFYEKGFIKYKVWSHRITRTKQLYRLRKN